MNELWGHQKEATKLLASQPATYLNHSMGCGKTRTVVEYLMTLVEPTVLIFAPKCVISNWRDEIHKWWVGPLPYVQIFDQKKGMTSAQKSKIVKDERRCIHGRTYIVVLNYEAAIQRSLGDALVGRFWDVCIADECHKIKAAGGKASRLLQRLGRRCRIRAGLSGTPLPHSPLDAYAQYRFLDPTIFGTSNARFKGRYSIMGGFEGRQVLGYQNVEEYQEKLNRIMHTVKIEDVIDLPPAIHQTVHVSLEPSTRSIYETMKEEMVMFVKDGTITAANALSRLLRLQQIVQGIEPQELSNAIVFLAAQEKRAALESTIESIDGSEPIVVFSLFKGDLQSVREVSEHLGRRCFELSGAANDLAEFKRATGPKLLSAQIRAGGVGINLTECRYCIMYSVGFSLGDYLQALARVHRPGQLGTVVYYHIVVRGSVDEVKQKALENREKVIDAILHKMKGATT